MREMTPILLCLAIAGCTAPAEPAPAPEPAKPAEQTRTQEQPQPKPKVLPKDTEKRKVAERRHQLNDLQKVEIYINGHKFRCWVMDSNDKRMEGMMFLEHKDFEEDEGMIFVFAQNQPLSFWMQNTLVDLDIAYVTQQKWIMKTYTMKSLDVTTDYSSGGYCKYAIEFKPGTFKKKNITAGMDVIIPDAVKAKD